MKNKDSMHEAADYAIRKLRREAKRDAKQRGITHEQINATISVKNRIQVGHLINHHGFLCVVTEKADYYFVYETLYDGRPTGEAFTIAYEAMAGKDPKPCWTTEQ